MLVYSLLLLHVLSFFFSFFKTQVTMNIVNLI